MVLRLYGWGATATAGTGAIGRLSGDDLAIEGVVTSAAANAPTITDFSPQAGSSGTIVTISGSNFLVGATTVRFGALESA